MLELVITFRRGGRPQMENRTHEGNYEGTRNMKPKNQDMAFVNDTIDQAKSTTNPVGAVTKKGHDKTAQ